MSMHGQLESSFDNVFSKYQIGVRKDYSAQNDLLLALKCGKWVVWTRKCFWSSL